MLLKAGEIYWAWMQEQSKRPVIVISRESLNHGKYCLVIPLTSAKLEARRELPNCVGFQQGDSGLPKDCVAQAEITTLVDISDLDIETGPIGKLDEAKYRDLVHAIGFVISSECEPI